MIEKIDLIYDIVKDIKDEQKTIREEQKEMAVEVGKLKVKSSLWGGVAGLLPASVVAVIAYFKIKTGV